MSENKQPMSKKELLSYFFPKKDKTTSQEAPATNKLKEQLKAFEGKAADVFKEGSLAEKKQLIGLIEKMEVKNRVLDIQDCQGHSKKLHKVADKHAEEAVHNPRLHLNKDAFVFNVLIPFMDAQLAKGIKTITPDEICNLLADWEMPY